MVAKRGTFVPVKYSPHNSSAGWPHVLGRRVQLTSTRPLSRFETPDIIDDTWLAARCINSWTEWGDKKNKVCRSWFRFAYVCMYPLRGETHIRSAPSTFREFTPRFQIISSVSDVQGQGEKTRIAVQTPLQIRLRKVKHMVKYMKSPPKPPPEGPV